MLIPVMSVTENIVLAVEPRRDGILLDYGAARERVSELARSFGFAIDPDAKIQDITVGQQQRVEILKALYRRADILILDEPTAVLTPQEAVELFGILRNLQREGMSIIFISHKLNEVLDIADRITVIRRGKVVGSRVPSETNEEDLAELMVGRDVLLTVDRGESHPGEPGLVVENLHVADDRGREVVHGVSFEVRKGEIFGIAGVAGNGQDELVEALTGLRKTATGKVTLLGTDITTATPRELHEMGVGFVPADRHRFGLVLPFPLTDNIVLNDYHQAPYARGMVRNEDAIRERCEASIAEYDVRTPSATVSAATLSGGNQQKLVVAREFADDAKLLVLDQPTRGLDVGSIEFIHGQAVKRRNAGTAILLVSAELDEVLELSDRVGIMYRGELVAVVDARTADREDVGLLMATGGKAPTEVTKDMAADLEEAS